MIIPSPITCQKSDYDCIYPVTDQSVTHIHDHPDGICRLCQRVSAVSLSLRHTYVWQVFRAWSNAAWVRPEHERRTLEAGVHWISDEILVDYRRGRRKEQNRTRTKQGANGYTCFIRCCFAYIRRTEGKPDKGIHGP